MVHGSERTFADFKANLQEEEANWNFAVTQPDRGDEIDKTTVKGSQYQKPYLEFSILASVIEKRGGSTAETSFFLDSHGVLTDVSF
jgi:hypothetical protein